MRMEAEEYHNPIDLNIPHKEAHKPLMYSKGITKTIIKAW